jgi:hypothetical protein
MAARDSAFGFPFTVDPGIARSSDNMTVQAANAGHYARVTQAGPVSKIGVKIGTQGGNISVAVYRNSGKGRLAVPGSRIATSGAVACPVAGYQEIALTSSVYVRQGDWLAISADGVVATFGSQLVTGADHDIGKGRQYRQATAHPLPATPSSLVATIGYTFILVGIA